MSYKVLMFDGLPVTEYLTRSDVQDITGGGAVTAFLQLPGGGFFDNFGSQKRPKNLEPIHKTGILWGDADEIKAELKAWKAREGKRGVLTIEWDNGALEWNWAVLQSALAPRSGEMKGGFLPIDLTWIKAGMGWRGPLHDDDAWVWGDESWVFGDGTAEFGGEGDYTWTLPDSDHTVTITNAGEIDAGFLVLRIDITGSWTDLTIVNETTGQQLTIDRDSAGTEPFIELNTGARTLYAGGATVATVTSASRIQNRIHVTTSGAHGLIDGDTVRLEGVGDYDGDYYPVDFASTTQFNVPIEPSSTAYGTVTTGTAQELTSLYTLTSFFDGVTFSDRKRWLTLAPGDNDIRIVWTPFPTSATLKAAYYDQYA